MPDKVWNICLCKTEHEADNVVKAGPYADTCHLVPAHIFVSTFYPDWDKIRP
jgi:hypothetical protein